MRSNPSRRGGFAAAGAFVIWGLLPLYVHPLHGISSLQVIAHRIVWSCVFVLLWMGFRGEMTSLRAAFRDRSVLLRLALTAALITANWLVNVWSVMHGHVVEASLGYFMGPLVNVSLGVVLLSERLTRLQWTSVAMAAMGVAYLTVMAGRPPWIALALAFIFALYGLIRKVVRVEALPGLAVETLMLFPVAAAYLIGCEFAGTAALGHRGGAIDALLLGCGPLTAVALYLFAYASRLLPYSTLGLMQYIAPTLQFACAVFALREPFDRPHAIGFAIIWTALVIFGGESLRLARKPELAGASQKISPKDEPY